MFEMIYAFRKKWYDIVGAVKKQAAAQQTFVFSAPLTRKRLTKANMECESTGFRVLMLQGTELGDYIWN